MMVEKKTKADDTAEPTAEELAAALEQASNWEFIDRVPSPEDVGKLLATLPEWWGVKPLDFLDYVQALPSEKKIQIPVVSEKTGGTRKEPRWFSVVTLYFSVAGRLQMCREAQELNGWRVDFTPEPKTPSGVPGFIDLGVDSGRIVYREYVEIWAPVAMKWDAVRLDQPLPLAEGQEDPNPMPPDLVESLQQQDLLVVPTEATTRTRWIEGQKFELLGRRPGMAWVPYTGGSQAKGSNPFEKVETASRGRALAAWGFGVLPGSGVASYEEMLGVPANRQGIAGETGEQQQGNGGKRETPSDLATQILQMAEQIRQLRGEPAGWGLAMLRDYAKKVENGTDVATAWEPDGMPGEIDLLKLKPGTLLIIRNGLRPRLVTARDDQEQGG